MSELETTTRRARRGALALLLPLFGLQLWVAAERGLFGDEAFYAACAWRPAWAYADHPFLTALLARGGQELLGATALGVRLGFVLCAATLPFLLRALARQLGASPAAAWAAAATPLALPLLGVAGTLAVPDVPLLALSLGALVATNRAARAGSAGTWSLAGLLMALALCTHLRGALVPLSAVLGLALTPAGRRALRSRGALLAGLLAALGLLPMLLAEWGDAGGALAFQLVERHADNAAGLAGLGEHLAVQIVALCTPLVFVLLVGGARELWRGARTGHVEQGLSFSFALTPLLVYLVASPFADADHANQHWSLPGWIVLLATLPGVATRWRRGGSARRRFTNLALGSAALFSVMLLIVAASGTPELRLLHRKFAGWREASARTLAQLGNLESEEELARGDVLLVADHYVLAAQLELALRAAGLEGVPVFSLDHEKNEDHGRARQYALWERDQAALLKHHAVRALVVLELSASGGGDRRARRAQVEALLRDTEELDKAQLGFADDPLLLRWWSARVP